MDQIQESNITTKEILMPGDFEHRMLRVGDLNMHMVVEGPEDGPLVVLLHGFSEFWYIWRYQIKALSAAGYRVVVPDQRGYNLTDKREPYDVYTLTKDVADLIRVLGRSRAVVIGHDWGGVVAWLFAALYPDMTEKIVISNCPHPAAFSESLNSFSLGQLCKSFYMVWFSVPSFAEAYLRFGNFRWSIGGHQRTLAARKPTEQELDVYREAFAQPGALTGGLSWYRAMWKHMKDLKTLDTKIRVPVLLLHGDPDEAFDRKTIEASRSFCTQVDTRYIENTGHFVPQDEPEVVNRLILEFLKQGRIIPRSSAPVPPG